MPSPRAPTRRAFIASALATAAVGEAAAQSLADFYRGRKMTLVTAASIGGIGVTCRGSRAGPSGRRPSRRRLV